MLNFHDFSDQLENPPVSEPDDERSLGDTTPPDYQIANAADDFGGEVMNANESPELKTITWDDMTRATTDDVEAHMFRMKALGYNPTKIGDRMSDEEFAQYTGMPVQADSDE